MLRLAVEGERVALEIGSLPGILELLRHEPATPAELEQAIEKIEDELMPLLRSLPAKRRLVTCAPEVREIARVAGLAGQSDLRLETATVELLFNRLADAAHGAPSARLGIPPGRVFAATLLLLREVLHHGGFKWITVTKCRR